MQIYTLNIIIMKKNGTIPQTQIKLSELRQVAEAFREAFNSITLNLIPTL